MARKVIPKGGRNHDANEAVKEDVGRLLERGGLSDAALDGVGHGRAQEDRPAKFHDRRDEDGLPHRQRFRADGRGEGVGHIVRANAKGTDKGEDAGNAEKPGVIAGNGWCMCVEREAGGGTGQGVRV